MSESVERVFRMERHKDTEEAAEIVLRHAADHLYNRSQWTEGDPSAIDLLDDLRENGVTA